MESIICKHWHHCPSSEVTTLLDTDPERGLSPFEAAHRLKKNGPNVVTLKKQQGPLMRFLLQFHQPLIYILLAAGAVTLFLQEWVDSSVILGVVIVNALIGFVQESKAQSAIESLKQMMTTQTTVLRDGRWQETDAANLVIGDIIQLQSGNKVPADVRLLRCRDLQVDESALTGESVPVIKKEDVLDPETILADRRNMAYAGTLVSYGQARAVVVATGDNTETGRISELIASAADLSTPLTIKIASFSKILLIAILILAGMTFAVGIWRGESAVDMFMAAVALAVGAIPEGLPAAVTITLAIGVNRMAKKKAIIRKLPAVETLGSTTVICSDKTGTLTENQMTVKKIFAGGVLYDVEGNGYAPEGHLSANGKEWTGDLPQGLRQTLTAGLLCNDSRLIQEGELWRIEGDPTEAALITAAGKAGMTPDKTSAEWPRLDEIPFESERQFMASLHHSQEGGKNNIYLKGAVEKILDACADAMDLDGGKAAFLKEDLLTRVDDMARDGLRVLALARKETDKKKLYIEDCLSGLTFLGLQGMIDPPRKEAIEAVRSCRQAGIAVKMITGDHAVTATEIARQLSIGNPKRKDDDAPHTLTGKELEKLTDEELIAAAENTSVFARVAPEQKLRLVEALQARNHIVAMTGDGVNDAPALKQANIGIAMGITGTDVSKEAADMVLTDDNFASITRAVEEGRRIFDNLVKFITWTLPTNGGEGLVILAAIAAGVTLPILPVQILWINMTTAVLLGLMLAFEPGEPDVMHYPPRDPKSPILNATIITRILLVTAIMMAAVFGIFVWQQQGYSLAQARTVAVNLLVMIELTYLFNCRSLTKSMFRIGVFSNPWVLAGSGAMILLQLLYTYTPVMNRVFQSQPISGRDWVMIIAISVAVYFVIGVEKWLRGRSFAKTA